MKKINSFNIENIGSFLKFTWNDSLKKIKKNKKETINLELSNIFYWDNWNWKSTIVKIFRKLNWDDVKLVSNWNNDKTDKKFTFNTENNKNYDYNLCSTEYNGKFVFFDKNFIKDNVWDVLFWNDSNENNKNRWQKIIILWWFLKKEEIINKYEYIIQDLWKKNKSFFYNIENKEKQINEKLKIKKIRKYKESELEGINKVKLKNCLEEIDKKEKQLKSIENIIYDNEELKNIDLLNKIKIIFFDKNEYEKKFKETIWWIDFKFQEKKYVENLLKITIDNKLGKCLFCNQKIKNNDIYIKRINELNKTFSDREKVISDKLLELEDIITYLKPKNNEIENLNRNNELKFSKFKKYCSDLEYNRFEISLNENNLNELDYLLEEIKEKNNIKSKSKNIDLSFLEKIIIELNKKINIFNEKIENINNKIKKLQSTNIEDKKNEKKQIKENLEELKDKKFIKNNFSSIIEFFREYERHKNNEDNIEKLIQNKNDFRKKISKEFENFSIKYWKYIWEVFKTLNNSLQINFNIENWSASYSKWAWRYWFKMIYRDKNILNDLSNWEKRSIALSYFFADIKYKIKDKIELEKKRKEVKWKEIWKIDKELKKINEFFDKILILDDPVVDFDNWHKKIIADFIAKYSKEFKQTFIFSHDSLFISYLKNSFDIYNNSNVKSFWIYKTKWISNITVNEKTVFNSYLQDLKDFNNNLTNDIIVLYTISYKLRFCIERFIKDEILGFLETNMNNLIDKIWNKKARELDEVKRKKLKSIYNFCNNNWSHFWENEWNNAVSDNVKKFLEVYDSINKKN